MASVWDGIGAQGSIGQYKQNMLSAPQYGNIKKLLQEMPEPAGDKAASAVGVATQMLQKNLGINDEVAIPLNAALADPKARASIIKIVQEKPEALGPMLAQIRDEPEKSAAIIAAVTVPATQPGATVVAGAPPAPAVPAPAASPAPARPPATASTTTGGDSGTVETSGRGSDRREASAGREEGGFMGWLKDLADIFKFIVAFIEDFIGGIFGGGKGSSSPRPEIQAGKPPLKPAKLLEASYREPEQGLEGGMMRVAALSQAAVVGADLKTSVKPTPDHASDVTTGTRAPGSHTLSA